jgi:hypothetical protein
LRDRIEHLLNREFHLRKRAEHLRDGEAEKGTCGIDEHQLPEERTFPSSETPYRRARLPNGKTARFVGDTAIPC